MHHILHVIEFILAAPLVITAGVFTFVGVKIGRRRERKALRS